jgi:hypothetical protein
MEQMDIITKILEIAVDNFTKKRDSVDFLKVYGLLI